MHPVKRDTYTRTGYTIKTLATMNANRRKWLAQIISKLEDLQQEVQEMAEQERECFENLPDALQQSERGETMEENADDLDETDTDFESLLDTLREVVER